MSFFSTDQARPVGSGLLSPEGSLTDAELSQIVRGYKRIVASNYRALTPEVLEYFIQPGPLHVSPKIDGQLWFCVIDGDEVALVSPKTRVLSGALPVLDEIRKVVAPRCQGRTILAGELWAAPRSGRARVGDVGSALGGGVDAEVKRLAFFPFDLVRGGDATAQSPLDAFADRLEVLKRLTDGGKRCRAVQNEVVNGHAEVTRLFEEWVTSGKTEGLVVRPADGRIFKVKPAHHIDAVVVGYTGRAEDPTLMRSMLMALLRDDGQYQILGALGNLGDDDQRRALMERVSPHACEAQYRHASSDGALYRFVEPQVILEFKVSDLQSDDSMGDAVQRMVLQYGDSGWQAVRKMPAVSIIHPVFVRVRDDKSTTTEDIGMRQVLDRVTVENLDQHVETLELTPSEIIGRAVYTKTTKDRLAVRKLLAWRTNKDEQDARFPAYVLHYTDYSPGRKAPLQRVVRLAPDLASLHAVWEQTATAKKVTARGWTEHEEGRIELPEP